MVSGGIHRPQTRRQRIFTRQRRKHSRLIWIAGGLAVIVVAFAWL